MWCHETTHESFRPLNLMVTICTTSLGRFHPFIGHKGTQGEQKYSSTLFQTSALEGGEGSASRPGSTLPPGKTRYPLYMRLGGHQGRSGLVRKISPPPGFDPRTVQPVGSRYTDDATRPTYHQFNIQQFYPIVQQLTDTRIGRATPYTSKKNSWLLSYYKKTTIYTADTIDILRYEETLKSYKYYLLAPPSTRRI